MESEPAPRPAPYGAAIVLLLVGAISVGYNGWDLSLLAGDVEIFDRAGLGWVASALLAIDGLLIASGLLQLGGGVGILLKRSKGRALGLLGSLGIVLGWIAFLVVAVSGDLLAGVSVPAWVMLLVSVSGSVLGGGLLLVSSSPRGTAHALG
jgi:hypothetical protein